MEKNLFDLQKLAMRLEKEWSVYGELYVGTAYRVDGDPTGYVIRVCTDDETIEAKLPKEVEGFPVEVSGIPRAGG